MLGMKTLWARNSDALASVQGLDDATLLQASFADGSAALMQIAPELHELATLAGKLVAGPGQAVFLRGLPLDTANPRRMRTQLHLLLGSAFPGHELVSADGVVPYWPVRDTAGSTFSLNSKFAPPHMDAVTMMPAVDVVGLCGVAQADSGGETYLIDVGEVLGELCRTRRGRNTVAVLRTSSVPHRRHSVFGESRLICQPILTASAVRWREDLFAFDERPDLDDPGLREAIATFRRALMNAPRQAVRIAPGEILVWHQRRLLHGRYAFQGPSRELLRFWLTPARVQSRHPSM